MRPTVPIIKEATGLVEAIVGRYADIALELGLADDVINRIRADLLQLLEGDKTNPERFIDAIKASGEDNNAKLVAAYFGAGDLKHIM